MGLDPARSATLTPRSPAESARSDGEALEAFTLTATVSLLAVGIAVLVLAMLSMASRAGIIAASAMAAGLAIAAMRPLWRGVAAPRGSYLAGLVLAMAVFVCSAGWAAFQPSNHVLLDRDPGSYVATGKWISNYGSLSEPSAAEAFGDDNGLVFESPGAYYDDNGSLSFQFLHLTAAVLSVADGVGGPGALFRIGALVGPLGLLCVYCIALRCTSRPLLSLAPMAALALTMPFLSAVRDVYSEPFALLFIWAAVIALTRAYVEPDPLVAFVAGALLGAATLARVDGLLALALLGPALTLVLLQPCDALRKARLRRAALWCILGAALTTGLAMADLVLFARSYLVAIISQVALALVIVAVSSAVSAALLWLWPRMDHSGLIQRFRETVGLGIASLVAIMIVLLWLVRPVWTTGRTNKPIWGLIGRIQEAESQPVDLYRSYAEESVQWMAWYLGWPTLVLAIVGIFLAIRSAFKPSPDPSLILTVGATLAYGAVYWWHPFNTPDHVWVMRRFLPAVIPGLAVLAAYAAARAVSLPRCKRWCRATALGVAAILMIAPPLASIRSVPLMREQHGFDDIVQDTCSALPESAAVLVLGDFDTVRLPQTLRSWCKVPVASAARGILDNQASEVRQLAEQVSAGGHTLWIVTSNADLGRQLDALYGPGEYSREVLTTNRLEHTVSRRPERYMTADESFEVPARYRLGAWRVGD